ncbi:transmembrane and immunoglobulin domain-containing protein 1 [Astyanax mexicanus]|uniref:transmembrane and immunoglobulin domain-containing protein 1 n=1 Tax=Astyanax mexicanus TaxID=7994 RepID=UPI0020CABB9E|nr:transmembrane and immunoglobulin domain-containing protein 1 [Astyanax mexicanus]XP_022526191.2 transmembrane and immunoglobulin domain-containing protein 1 [Astyanax mexicanus]
MVATTAAQMKRVSCLILLSCLCHLTAGVTVQVSPQEEAVAHLGSTVTLSCEVQNSDGEEELQWSRNSGLVDLQEGNRLSQSHLCVQNLTRDDHQVKFTCQLKRNASVSSSVKMSVLYPPILSGEENVTMEETRESEISCPVQANPQVTVSWLRNGVAVDLLKEGYTLYQDSSVAKLIITKPDREQHQGTFTCIAESSVFGNMTKFIHVKVVDKTMAFPLGPLIAGCVVILCTVLLAVLSKWSQIAKCCKYKVMKAPRDNTHLSQH